MGRPLTDLTGMRFGSLVVTSRDEGGAGRSYWTCRCDCGNAKSIAASSLKSGGTRSCGCLNKKAQIRDRLMRVTHGKTGSHIYIVWQGMRRRCEDPRVKAYPSYGGRGISVCEEWRHKFEGFYQWAMSSGYASGLSIDRIDNAGNYCPENCRWATPSEQANNRRNNRRATINGATKTLTEFAREYGIDPNKAHQRIKRGWNVSDALGINQNG